MVFCSEDTSDSGRRNSGVGFRRRSCTPVYRTAATIEPQTRDSLRCAPKHRWCTWRSICCWRVTSCCWVHRCVCVGLGWRSGSTSALRSVDAETVRAMHASPQASLFGTETVTDAARSVARLKVAPVTHAISPQQIDEAFTAAQTRGNEGLMLKSLESTYQPGRRGSAWIKAEAGAGDAGCCGDGRGIRPRQACSGVERLYVCGARRFAVAQCGQRLTAA